jgi:uncharacterized protein (DUF58 family)
VTLRERWKYWLHIRIPQRLAIRDSEFGPVRLHRKCIYVLPTRFGLSFALMILAIVFGALNYNNNMALLFGFLSGSLGLLSNVMCFRGLSGLQFLAIDSAPTFAGNALILEYRLATEEPRDRIGLIAKLTAEPVHFSIRANSAVDLQLRIPAKHRGYMVAPPLKIYSEWPFGIFHVWGYFWPRRKHLIYPSPELHPPDLPSAGLAAQGNHAKSGDEELRGLRPYVVGDPLRRIAWRASARHLDWLVKDLHHEQAAEVFLDYDQLSALNHEARISRLTAWIMRAEQNGLHYGLKLPQARVPTGGGEFHFHACLKELALSPGFADAP